CTTLYGIDYW
nr:immunoglobulin heavy chain junction region [Mus musculus]